MIVPLEVLYAYILKLTNFEGVLTLSVSEVCPNECQDLSAKCLSVTRVLCWVQKNDRFKKKF